MGPLRGLWGHRGHSIMILRFFAGSVEYFVGGSVVLSGASGVSLGPLWAHYHDIAFLAGSVW